MKVRLSGAGLVLFGVAVAWFSGCRADVRVYPSPASPPPLASTGTSAVVTRTGYTVQVGAFSVPDNARRLAQALSDIGLDAYYFPQGSGLYRVRFGDFPSREDAVLAAERLNARRLIDGYFIIGPPELPVDGPALPGGGLREKIAATATGFLGVEYAWGGTSSREGVDCSGLVRAVYRLNGLDLPRSTTDQYGAGTTVPRDRLRKGDLVFFAGVPGRPVSHVGIYVGKNAFIHAPGTGKTVREESLDSPYFSRRFSGARTYLD
ncbi:MAG: NlpC/P60 family protein [Candidatus Aminicenantes bacterium]